MFFRETLFAAMMLAATTMDAQIIEDISMLTLPGSGQSEPPAQAVPMLPALDPASLVIVTWDDGTNSTVPASMVLAWYSDEPEQ